MEFYEVGGCIRDEIMGYESKDIDFTVVMEDYNIRDAKMLGISLFDLMVTALKDAGFKVFLETPQFLTVRAQFPKNHKYSRLTADFVLARKEGEYTDGRRPDVVEPGTLEDDLARRDFTMNAIAKAEDGTIIDPFGGKKDIYLGLIRCVGDPMDRFTEDALRAVRALRFSVTKDMKIAQDVRFAMESQGVIHAIENKISDERIDIELKKMFAFDTVKSVVALNRFPALTRAMFSGRVSLTSTMKQQKG